MSDCVRLIRVCVSLQNQKRQKMEYLVLSYKDKNTGLTWYLTDFRVYKGVTSCHWHTDLKTALLIFPDQIQKIMEFVPVNQIPTIYKQSEVAPVK